MFKKNDAKCLGGLAELLRPFTANITVIDPWQRLSHAVDGATEGGGGRELLSRFGV